MVKLAGISIAFVAALALVAGCSDDTDNPPQTDGKTVYLDGGGTADSTVDGSITQDDQGPLPDSAPPQTGPNTGAICTQSAPCTGGDSCIAFAQGATKGMCLSSCNKAGDSCPVKDSSTQMSACLGQTSKGLICLYVCEANGKSYSCPTATDYDCKALDPKQPNSKVCIPK